MQKVQVVNAVANRYFIGESTSGSTSDVYLSDGVVTVKLEDCLIWDSECFEDEEFYDIVEHLNANNGVGVEGYEGWTLVKEQV
jgi:hypothetical protein